MGPWKAPPKTSRPKTPRPQDATPVLLASARSSLKPNAAEDPIAAARGKSLMTPQAAALHHPAASMLLLWAENGVPVDCGPPWSGTAIEAAIHRGPHTSAMTTQALKLFQEDIEYQVAAGFSQVVLWETIKRNPPPALKISPAAVVPQRGRRGRIILDLSFDVRAFATPQGKPKNSNGRRPQGTILQSSVNETTTPLAPSTAVKQIATVLPELLAFLAAVPDSEPVLFSKLDISDGFWRLVVADTDRWNFAYVLPATPGSPLKLVVPSALQMGWRESPAFFCTATQTAADLITEWFQDGRQLGPHPLEKHMIVPDIPILSQWSPTGHATAQQFIRVYVDDFILAFVPDRDESRLRRLTRAALHGIHAIFPPPAVTGDLDGKDPVSLKKLLQLDGAWASKKVILGFEFDSQARTVRLPQDKAALLDQDISDLLAHTRAPCGLFLSVIGKIRHATQILPAARGLFTPLNAALSKDPNTKHVGIGTRTEIRKNLEDVRVLLEELSLVATHVKQLVPGPPHFVGYCDACSSGAGGVWFTVPSPNQPTIGPIVWRFQFPPDITHDVVSSSNPKGRLTNSDLELAGYFLAYTVLATIINIRHKRLTLHSDNTPTVSWIQRMASRSQTPISGRLLRGFTLLDHQYGAGPGTPKHVAGKMNQMADIASRSWTSTVNLSAPTAFAHYFDSHFPQPTSWTHAHPSNAVSSKIVSTLRGQRLDLRTWGTTMTAGEAGINGSCSVDTST